jgi:hypothetical protein
MYSAPCTLDKHKRLATRRAACITQDSFKFQFIEVFDVMHRTHRPLFEGAVSIADWGSVKIQKGYTLALRL